MSLKSETTRTEEITLGSDGIIYCRILPNVEMNLEDARENIRVVSTMVEPGVKLPVLVDIRGSKGATKEARKYFTSDEPGSVQSACAMLVDSKFSQLLGSFFIGFNRPVFPLKLFTKEADALAWLKQFL